MQNKSSNIQALLIRKIVAQFIGFAKSFLILPLLTPGAFGIYRYILVIISYTSFFHFGAVSTLGMTYPSALASKNSEFCNKIQYFTFINVIIGFIISIFFIFFLIIKQASFGIVISISIIGAANVFIAYVNASYRVRNDFKMYAKNDIISQVCGLLLFFIFGYFFGLWGYLIGGLSPALISSFIGRKWFLKIKMVKLTKDFVFQNTKYGSVLLFSSILTQMAITIDMLFLKQIFPQNSSEFGYYAFGAMLAGLINNYAGTITEVETQNLLTKYGKDKEKISNNICYYIFRDNLFTIFIMVALICCVCCAVQLFFKKYTPALQVLAPFALAAVILRLRNYPIFILNLYHKTRFASLSTLIGVVICIIYIKVVNITVGVSLVAFSYVSFVTYIVVWIMSLYYALKVLGIVNIFWSTILKMFLVNSPLSIFFILPFINHKYIWFFLVVSSLISLIMVILLYYFYKREIFDSFRRISHFKTLIHKK